jgi:hypothetical protein
VSRSHRHRQDWKDAGFARALVKPVDPFVLCAIIPDVIKEATAQAVQPERQVSDALVPLSLVEERSAGTITVAAIQRLHASARASCQMTRRLREDSQGIREQARITTTGGAGAAASPPRVIDRPE